MTILSAQTIRARVLGGEQYEDPYDGTVLRSSVPEAMRLTIEPFCERTVHEETGMSYGLSGCGYDLRIRDELRLNPGGFALATTVEHLAIPIDLRGCLASKSSWVRAGVTLPNTRFEPGWCGYPTVALTNRGPDPIVIPAGAPIGQMEFELLDQPTDQPYTGKYQDQPQRPVEAIREGGRFDAVNPPVDELPIRAAHAKAKTELRAVIESGELPLEQNSQGRYFLTDRALAEDRRLLDNIKLIWGVFFEYSPRDCCYYLREDVMKPKHLRSADG